MPQVVMAPPKSWLVTLLLCLFLGPLGIHRFYSGHIAIGLLQFFTGGGFGIWWLVDLILILTGSYTDSYGRPLQK
jgi:TM2 domain-containing membrane protein YozV